MKFIRKSDGIVIVPGRKEVEEQMLKSPDFDKVEEKPAPARKRAAAK